MISLPFDPVPDYLTPDEKMALSKLELPTAEEEEQRVITARQILAIHTSASRALNALVNITKSTFKVSLVYYLICFASCTKQYRQHAMYQVSIITSEASHTIYHISRHFSCAIHHIPYTIHHIPYTIYHTPYTIYHTPYTIYHIPYTIHHIP
ncbi:hypothetical protein EON63_08950, partial [archaeon]